MKTISCLILDDEPYALEQTEEYVLQTPFLSLKGKCASAFEALEVINREKIDLVFADIQMPGLNGIDFSKSISPSIRIIFTTAFKDFALEGFRVNAVDYLLKPFDYKEFLKGANKACQLILGQDEKTEIKKADYIFVKSEYRQVKIMLNQVFYFEGLGDYVKIWITSQPKPIMTLMSLKMLESELPADDFMRVHRSFIIALNKIESIERSQVIINKQRITIADQYKPKFQLFLEQRSIS